MKRTLCLFLALIFAVGICFSAPVTITASAAFNLESGEENTVGAVYCDDETGLKFEITDTENKYVEVYGYNNPSANLTIPAIVTIGENEYSVTSIGIHAFSSCTSLETVTIGNSVTSIGNYAFSACTALATVTIPDSVTTIGNYTFNACTALATVTIPDSVTTIGNYTFNACTALATVTIGKGVTTIGDYAFNGCDDLTTVNVPCSWNEKPLYTFEDGVEVVIPKHTYENGKCTVANCDNACAHKTITDGVCVDCGGKHCGNTENDKVVWFYDSKTTILTISGTGAMADYTGYDMPWYNYQNDITKVVIENGVTTIGEFAFNYCSFLTSVTIPESVTSIGDFAFAKCTSLEAVTIGEGVTTIGDYAFSGCKALASVTMGDSVTSIGDSAFEECTGLTSVTIPDSVTTISGLAFLNCSKLTSVTIPKNVTTIGRYAFDGCAKLTSINVNGANTKYSSVDGVLFNADKTELICYPAGKDATSYTIPESVTAIGEGAFKDCTALTSVTIGEGVTEIDDYAFEGCEDVNLIVEPGSYAHEFAKTNSIPYIFNGCITKEETDQIEKLTFTEIRNDNNEVIAYSVTFCDTQISGELKIPATYNGKPVTKIGNNAFSNCKSLTSVVIPDSVVSLGEKAFYFCDSLETVTLSSNITVIPNDAFAYCLSLKKLPITENITSIGERAFYDSGEHGSVSLSGVTLDADAFRSCGITELTLVRCKLNDASVFINNDIEKLTLSGTNIPDEMFDGDSYIKTLVAENSVLGSKSFKGCSSLKSVTVSGGEINAEAFVACSSLETVTIDNIGSVGENAFNNCQALKTVEVDATKISEGAFALCYSLKNVKLGDELEVIEINAFEECRELTEIVIPESVTTIGESAFSGCGNIALKTELGSIVHTYAKDNNIKCVFNGYTEAESAQIYKLTFALNDDGESYSVTRCDTQISGALEIPATYNGKPITAIGVEAFYNCDALTSVTIPESVTTIGDYAFCDCAALSTLNISGVEIIGEQAFRDCITLKKIDLSNVEIGSNAFEGCKSVTEVNLDKCTIGSNVFGGLSSLEIVTCKDTDIPDYEFYGNKSLKTVTISGGEIGEMAFGVCAALSTLNISGVEIIGRQAFRDCITLKKIDLSNVEIGSSAFEGCKSVTEVYLDKCTIGSNVFLGLSSLEIVTCKDTDIPYGAFHGDKLLKTVTISGGEIGEIAFCDCDVLSSLNISGVETIGKQAFKGCTTLKKIDLSNVEIGRSAFEGCKSVTEVNLDKCTIGLNAFSNLTSLETVTCKDTDIPDSAFKMNNSLKTVTISGGEIGREAFGYCEYLETIEVEAKKISESAFAQCTSLKNVKLGDNVEIIGTAAFEACRELTEVVIPASVTSIDAQAFYSCSNLKCIFFKGTEAAQKTIGDELNTYAKIHYGSSTHTFNENYTVDVEPTCTEKGSESQHCKYCDLTQNERDIKEKGHTSVKGGTESAHTICSVCKVPLSTEHKLTSKITTEPTCTKEGVETFTCECGYTYTKPVEAKGHTEVTVTGKAATCTATGLTDGKKCSVCGTVTKAQETIKATGHKEVVIPAVAPTFTTVGKTEGKKCSVCGTVTVAQKDVAKLTLATPTVTQKNTAKGIEVNWNKIDGAESYVVYRSVYSGGKWSKWASIKKGVTGTSYVDGTVKLGTKYKYTVRAVNGSVMSGYQNTKDGLKYNVTPTVKVALASNGIKVSWSTAANATGYTVYSSTYNTKTKKWSGWTNRGTTKANATSWVDKKAKSGTKYRYTVKAMNDKVGSTYNKDGAATLYLAQPTVKIANASTGVKVSWSKVTGATGYTVYRSEYKNGAWTKWASRGTAKANKTSWTDTKVASGVQYKYTVRAINGKVASTYVSSNTVLYLAQPKTTVKAVSNGINVAWTQSAGATGYTVYRMEYNTKTKKWSSWKNMGTAKSSKTNWTDKSAKKGVTYKYTTKAINGKNASTYKASGSVKR